MARITAPSAWWKTNLPAAAEQLRGLVLERRNSAHAMEIFRGFAGREPDVKSLLRKYSVD